MSSIYLAGPIAGCSYKGATNWRRYVRAFLNDLSEGDFGKVAVLSPMRDKKDLAHEESIAMAYDTLLSSPAAILWRDFYDVCRADLLLVNFLGADRMSLGTAMEIGWAYQAGKPIIIAMEESNPHQHPMIVAAASVITDDLDQAIYCAYSFVREGL